MALLCVFVSRMSTIALQNWVAEMFVRRTVTVMETVLTEITRSRMPSKQSHCIQRSVKPTAPFTLPGPRTKGVCEFHNGSRIINIMRDLSRVHQTHYIIRLIQGRSVDNRIFESMWGCYCFYDMSAGNGN